jgi:tRNA A-37 threonylcarbamoyl transferase component Bud32
MKSKEELKKELHALIDSIDDEETLNVLHDDVVPYVIDADLADTDTEEELTAAQMERLDEALQQVKDGKVMSFEEFKSRMAQWHTS